MKLYGCSGLNSIYVKRTTPALLENVLIDPFDAYYHNYNIATLYVSKGSLEAYRNAYGWKEFKNIQEWDAK